MDKLRRRVPFKNSESGESDDDNRVLDDQEQEAVIKTLKQTSDVLSRQYLVSLRIILALSLFLQLLSFYGNPLLIVLPSGLSPSIPIPALFTSLSIILHINVAVLAFFGKSGVRFRALEGNVRPLSFQLSYVLSAVAPALSLFLQRSWQSTAWWSITAIVVFVAQTITSSIDEGNESISELESMRYVAPGV